MSFETEEELTQFLWESPTGKPVSPQDRAAMDYGRVLKFNPNQPRDEDGKWTDKGYSLNDLLEEVDYADSPEVIGQALSRFGAEEVFPGIWSADDHIIEWEAGDTYTWAYTKEDWVRSANPDDYYPGAEEQFNKDFWEYPTTLYHNTQDENAESIDREGLATENKTRGITNRGVGHAVFTTTEPEEYALGSYGDTQYAIATTQMRDDGYKPWVEQEPGIRENTLRAALANKIGLDNYIADETWDGTSPWTVILYDHIPPKYLERLTYKQACERVIKEADRMTIVRKYNENQPRYPAGHPKGGQWMDTDAGVTLSAPFIRARDLAREEVLKWGSRTGNERFVLVSQDGVKLHTKGGGKSSVEFDSYTRTLMWDRKRRMTLVHNHPRMSGLSRQDLQTTISPGMHRIEAIGRDGPERVISEGYIKGVTPLIDRYDAQDLSNKFRDVFAIASEETREYMQPVVNTQNITLYEAGSLDSYAKLDGLAEVGLIEHNVSDTGALKAMQQRFNLAAKDKQAYKKMVAGIADRVRRHNSYLVYTKYRDSLDVTTVGKQEQRMPLELFGLIDPPNLDYASTEEMREWLAELEMLPMFDDKPQMMRDVHAALAARGSYAFVFKYDPNQPRHSAGSGKGGQWKSQDILGEPGTLPVREGHVRLYHQTSGQNIDSIVEGGIQLSEARGIEGPKAIYAGETPFYGAAHSRPTIEFQVPKDKWMDPFVLQDAVTPDEFLAVHLPWHSKARYLAENPKLLEEALQGKFDDLEDDYQLAVNYIKDRFGKVKKYSPDQPRHPAGSSKGGQFAKKPISKGLADEVSQWNVLHRRSDDFFAHVYNTTGTSRRFDEAEAKVKELIPQGRIVINRTSQGTVWDILEGGRFKTQFETRKSQGVLDPTHRAEVEEKLFGYSVEGIQPSGTTGQWEFEPEVPHDQRPVYGVLADDTPSGLQGAWSYGRYSFVLRDTTEVKARTTWTGNDSLSIGGKDNDPYWQPSPMLNPNLMSGLERGYVGSSLEALEGITGAYNLLGLKSAFYGSYIEAQVHGSVKASDIERLRYPAERDYDLPDKVIDMATRKGIVLERISKDSGVAVQRYSPRRKKFIDISDGGDSWRITSGTVFENFTYEQAVQELDELTRKYDASQPRDKAGRWTKLYHVTQTDNVSSIQAGGIKPFQTTNWVQAGTGERYGEGQIFAFEARGDAVRWATKWDWSQNTATGTGKISIIEFESPEGWEQDTADPLGQAGADGQWLKRYNAVLPEELGAVTPVTNDLIKETVAARNKRLLKFDANQPRHPAGSEKGGQWSKKPGFLSRVGNAILNLFNDGRLPTPDYYGDLLEGKVSPVNINPQLLQQRETNLKKQANLMGANDRFTAAQSTVNRIVRDAEVAIQVKDNAVLDRILADGRFKSQAEVPDAPGFADQDYRQHNEEVLFGLSEGTEPKDRPIYGYLTDDSGASRVGLYGDVKVVLKAQVHDNTTFTANDSLGTDPTTKGVELVPSSKAFPSMASVLRAEGIHHTRPRESGKQLDTLAGAKNLADLRARNKSWYYEAQVHKGVQVTDIARVESKEPLSRLTTRKLDELGIPYSVIKFDPKQPRYPKGHPKGGQWMDTTGMPNQGTLPGILPQFAAMGEVQGQALTENERIQREIEQRYRVAQYRVDLIDDRENTVWDRIYMAKDWGDATAGYENMNRAFDQAQANTEDLLRDGEILIQRSTSRTLDKILADGRMKTQHETQTSKGMMDPAYRAGAEHDLFGIGESLEESYRYFHEDGTERAPDYEAFPKEFRPVYGHVMDRNDSGGFSAASQYGRYQFVLKDEISKRTTVTGDDSLRVGDYGEPYLVPSPMRSPSVASFIPLEWGGEYQVEALNNLIGASGTSKLRQAADGRYIEAQIHGQVRLQDMKELRVPSEDVLNGLVSQATIDGYRSAGVKVMLYDDRYPGQNTKYYEG